MVTTIKIIIRYFRFKIATRKCAKMRNNGIKCYVFNIGGKPVILDRKAYRALRFKGIIRQKYNWQMMKDKAIY